MFPFCSAQSYTASVHRQSRISLCVSERQSCVYVCVCVYSALCALLTHRQCPLLSLLSLLIPIDVFHFARAQLQVGDVKNIASRNGSLLIMQIGAPLMGIFCFRNYIPLSQVRLHLSNFTGIVTKIQKWVSSICQSRFYQGIKIDICLFFIINKSNSHNEVVCCWLS